MTSSRLLGSSSRPPVGLGGWARPGGPFTAADPPGEIVDSYGAGDSFAAGLTFALGSGLADAEAIGFAARCGAAALTGRGVAPQPVPLELANPASDGVVAAVGHGVGSVTDLQCGGKWPRVGNCGDHAT